MAPTDEHGTGQEVPPRMELISQREYARRLGISHVAVQHAVKAGRIHLIMGKIDPVAADLEWHENTDQSNPRNRITGRPKAKRAPGEPSTPMDLRDPSGANGGNGSSHSYAAARARREVANAARAELLLDQDRRTLVPAAEVKLAAFNMARKTRDQLIAIPERVAAILASTQDPTEVQRILDQEIERICQELGEG